MGPRAGLLERKLASRGRFLIFWSDIVLSPGTAVVADDAVTTVSRKNRKRMNLSWTGVMTRGLPVYPGCFHVAETDDPVSL